MRNNLIRNRIIWGIGTIIALSICYILSRHDVLGQWHHMIEWPRILFAFGLIVAIIAAIFYCRKVMICTVAGYMVGFVLDMLLNSNYAGPGDTIGTMSYNNGWIIWTCAYIGIIVLGLIWEIISRRLEGRKISK